MVPRCPRVWWLELVDGGCFPRGLQWRWGLCCKGGNPRESLAVQCKHGYAEASPTELELVVEEVIICGTLRH